MRQVALMSSPAGEASSAGQPRWPRSISVSVSGCGSENSHVPPASQAKPLRHSAISAGEVGWRSAVTVLRFIACVPNRLWQIVERGGAGARSDQSRPLMRAEGDRRRQEWLHPVFRALRGDFFACIPAHQLVVHQIVIAEKYRAHRAVGDDPGKRLEHVFRCRRKGDCLNQHQSAVYSIGTKKLRKYAVYSIGTKKLRKYTEQHIILPRDIDRVACRVHLVPVAAEQPLPFGDNAHPMVDLRLGRP